MKKTLFLLFGSILFFSFDSLGQCSADNIMLYIPSGTCTSYAELSVYANVDADYFTVYERVEGWGWQQVTTAPNDGPPISIYLTVTQTTLYGITYFSSYSNCESPMKQFTISPTPPAPAVTGSTHVCYGQGTTFTVSGVGESYRWYAGSTLITETSSTEFNTGALYGTQTYYVAAVSGAGCEGLRNQVTVTVHNPSPPTPYNVTRCRTDEQVTLSAPSGHTAYQWYDQNNTVLGTTSMSNLTLTNAGVTSYKLKVQDSWGCWSGMSAAATITSTHPDGPMVVEQSSCSSVTMKASYAGNGSYGDYVVEWYTTATGVTPEYTAELDLEAPDVSYSPNLSGPKTYWVAVYDSYAGCRTPRTQITVAPPPARSVWGNGLSCETGKARIEAHGQNVTSYSLYYRYDPAGQNYQFVASNTTGVFELDDFESDDPENVVQYYLKGSGGGCQTVGYTQVSIDVLRPPMPIVTGNFNPCYNTGTILTASGGSEGSYRWYLNSAPNPVSGQNGSQFPTGNLTAPASYHASYIVQGTNGQCESPKRTVNVSITPLSSVTGFSISPGTEFYGIVSPPLTLSHTSQVGSVTYETSTNDIAWSGTPSVTNTDHATTYFRAKAVSGNCAPAYSRLTVSLFPLPAITISEGVNYLSYGNTLHLSTGTYHAYQWVKDGQDIAGANQQNFIVTEPGVYAVRVKGSPTLQQVTSESVTIYIDAVQSQNLNYISTITPLAGGLDPSALHTIRPDQYLLSTTYFDGLGRPMQTVIAKGSPQADDVIQPIVYDGFGREKRKYLPFVNPDRNAGLYIDNGLVIAPANGYDYIGDAASFYDSPETKVPDDDGDRPYAETIFEQSPLNRIIEQGAPGAVWQPGTGKTIKKAYQTNGAEEVRLWTYTNPGAEHPLGLVNSEAPYAANELFKTITTDEHGNDIIEYVDKEGRIALKRVQVVDDEPDGDAPPVNDTNYAGTYYIYNELGNLVCVIQPEGVKNIAGYMSADGNGKETFLQKWAFRYRYDGRNRMIIKQVPGADSVVMVYDNRDRLVLTQDGNQRTANQWSFTKYDALNRPVITGIYTNENDRADMQADVNSYYGTLATDQAWYDSYTGLASGNAVGYDGKSFPQENIVKHFTVTYYDTYDPFVAPAGYNYQSQGLPDEEAEAFTYVKGQVTGMLVKNLTTDVWMRTVNYYDDQYRIIQTIADHQKGKVRTSNVYDFTSRLLHSQRRYIVDGISKTIKESFNYDPAGRQMSVTHAIDGAASPVVLTTNEYNELGQLVAKKLHKTNAGGGQYVTPDPAIGQPGVVYGSNIDLTAYDAAEHTQIATNRIRLLPGFYIPTNNTFKARIGYSQQDAEAHNAAIQQDFRQVIDYRYNIRGWLNKINDPAAPSADDLFNMELRYNQPSAQGGPAQYNGNISEAVWRSAGLDKQAYGYSYDNMNRLIEAKYFNAARPQTHYDEKIGMDADRPAYDLNGNIRNLLRYGKTAAGTYGLIDDLRYDYTNNGNRLVYVSDDRPTNAQEEGFKEVAAGEGTTVDFIYDANGNMTKDENKGIASIEYNHLNLPSKVSKTASEYIIYTYDATGRKLAQQVFGSEAKITDYIGDLVYENGSLRFINHSEGRALPDNTPGAADLWEYQYFIKDHLGNTRVVFSEKSSAMEYRATMENGTQNNEMATFRNYSSGVRSSMQLFDHTDAGTIYTYAQLLNGGNNSQVGLAKSFEVNPGDVFDLEVYAKYEAAIGTPPNNSVNDLLSALISAFSLGAGTTPLDGSQAQGAFTTQFPAGGPWIGNDDDWDATAPKAYLNYLLFDENFELVTAGFDQISTSARQEGVSPVKEHDYLSLHVQVQQKGYLYIYISNEDPVPTNVYFDDMKIVRYTAVEQVNDYYPFGLTFNSYSRENSAPQDYKFNGKEEQNELGLGWIDYGLRMYQPDIGRWGVIDPAADKYYSYSPFVYCGNSPTNIVDPNGADWIIKKTEKDGKVSYNITLNAKVYNNSEKKLDMGALTKQIKSQLESTFSTGNIDGDIEVNTTVNIEAVSSLDDVKDTDHLVMIEDDQKYEEMASEQGGVNTNGYADAGGLKVVLPHKTAAGILGGSNTRTISHEFGHTGGLYHPDAVTDARVQGVNKYDKGDGNNLMYGSSSGGKSIKAAQIQSMYNYYQAGRINQQTQFKREGHIMFTPALNPGLMYYQTRGGVNYTGQKWVDWKDRVFGPSN